MSCSTKVSLAEMEVMVEAKGSNREGMASKKRKRSRREKKPIRRIELERSEVEMVEWMDEEEADMEDWISNCEYWESYMGFCDPFKDITSVSPMRYTEGPIPTYAVTDYALQIFSIQVTEAKDGLEWPLHVYGQVATRDSVDPKRNFLFNRTRDNCQILTQQDSYLLLTGPTRAVVLIDPVCFQVDLKVKMEKESEDKLLNLKVFHHHMVPVYGDEPYMIRECCSSKRSTIEVTYAALLRTVEATVNRVQVIDGSWPDHLRGRVVCYTTSIDEGQIVLLDAKDGRMPITCDGGIALSRNFVSVNVRDQLIIDVVASLNDENSVTIAKDTAVFTPEKSGSHHGIYNLGFCKVQISVAWSLLATLRDMMLSETE